MNKCIACESSLLIHKSIYHRLRGCFSLTDFSSSWSLVSSFSTFFPSHSICLIAICLHQFVHRYWTNLHALKSPFATFTTGHHAYNQSIWNYNSKFSIFFAPYHRSRWHQWECCSEEVDISCHVDECARRSMAWCNEIKCTLCQATNHT